MPYGVFGILGWFFSTLSVLLKLVLPDRESLLSKWFGKKTSLYLLTAAYSLMAIGPVIYTCVKCQVEWYLILVSLGRLSSGGFSIICTALSYKKAVKEGHKNEYSKLPWWRKGLYHIGLKNETMKSEDKKMKEYLEKLTPIWGFSIFLLVLSSILGWVGTTGLLIHSRKIEGNLILLLFLLYLVAILPLFYTIFWLYFTATLHIIVSSILVSIITHKWIGIKIDKIAAIIYIIGEFLLTCGQRL